MLFRKTQGIVEEWLRNGTKPLMITGARQVGKSFVIRETLKKNNVDFVEFNFIKDIDAKNVFQSLVNGDFNSLAMAIGLLSKRKMDSKTVIFLDEVQEIKEILTVVKFLAEKGGYKYILSGSLLGVELTNLKSAPVGYLETEVMYPLDLEEFYIANGIEEEVLEYLKSKFIKREPVSENIHNALMETFYRYLIVGGMPEAVQTYIDKQDLNEVIRIHKNISNEYKRDFTKYEENSKLKLIKTYELIPSELNSKNKRYTFTNLDKNLKFDKYENSFNWLIDAGVTIPTYNVTEFQLPLEASKKSNLFKLFLSDVGMLSSFYGRATILKLLSHGDSINCGAIYENFVAQEINSHGFKPFYFNNKKHGEVDFLLEYNEELLPIEVKSGKDYQIHSALSYFMNTPYFKNAIVFSNFNLHVKGNITYLPIYMAMFLNNDEMIGKIPHNDLSSISIEEI